MHDIRFKNHTPSFAMTSIVIGWLQQKEMDNELADAVLLRQDPAAIEKLAIICNQKTNFAIIGMHPQDEKRKLLFGYFPKPSINIELVCIDMLGGDGEYKYELAKTDQNMQIATIASIRCWDHMVNNLPKMPQQPIGVPYKSLERAIFETSEQLRELHAETEVVKYFQTFAYFNKLAQEYNQKSKDFQNEYIENKNIFNHTQYPLEKDIKLLSVLKINDLSINTNSFILNAIYSSLRFLSARTNVARLEAINTIVSELK